MAYVISCDNDACKAVLESGEHGRPSLSPKRHVYCHRCSTLVAAVEEEVRKQVTQKALLLAGEVEALRKSLMREMFPATLNGDDTPRKGLSNWPKIEAAE